MTSHRLSEGVRVLVTGGAGYIGSHGCKALAKAGMVPVVYDNLSRGHADAVRWGPLVVADVRDRARLEKVLRAERIEAVIHFAALAYVGESVREPQRYYENNVGGDDGPARCHGAYGGENAGVVVVLRHLLRAGEGVD